MQSFAKLACVAAVAMMGAVEVTALETTPTKLRHRIEEAVYNMVEVYKYPAEGIPEWHQETKFEHGDGSRSIFYA